MDGRIGIVYGVLMLWQMVENGWECDRKWPNRRKFEREYLEGESWVWKCICLKSENIWRETLVFQERRKFFNYLYLNHQIKFFKTFQGEITYESFHLFWITFFVVYEI